MPFSLLIFSDENNIAKIVSDMWGNCFNRLYQLLYNWNRINMFSKSSHSQIFYKKGVLKNFAKFTWKHPRPVTLLKRDSSTGAFREIWRHLKNSFSTEQLWTFASEFFHSFNFFFATLWTKRNQAFSIFEQVLSRLSNVMNIMNFAIGKLCETDEGTLKHLSKLTRKDSFLMKLRAKGLQLHWKETY